MEHRTFQIDGQWNIIHYPFKPNGFAILLIGDNHHFVEENNSYWNKHQGRLSILDQLKNSGYTIFSSNFYGANWGSKKAEELAVKLYHILMKSEILNEKIHILAEGTGALTALRLMNTIGSQIRSVVLMDPCLSLKDRIVKEKENKFYYHKVLIEVADAYGIHKNDCEKMILGLDEEWISQEIPVHIIHVLGSIDARQSLLYKTYAEQGKQVGISFLLPEKRYKIPMQIQQMYRKYERTL
jgi:hypothetical protein